MDIYKILALSNLLFLKRTKNPNSQKSGFDLKLILLKLEIRIPYNL